MDNGLDVAEQRPPSLVTREVVEADVQDWKNRLYDLFQQVRIWAMQNGWTVNDTNTVSMDEELMREFDVPVTDQPTLRLDSHHRYALFKPKGLWVIGANGRVDLYTSKGTFIIVDLAERGAPPRWTIFRATTKRNGDVFTPEMIASLA